MSIFSRLFSRPAQPPKPVAGAQRQPALQQHQASAPAAAMPDLKQQRQDRRDHLYSVVRDAMLRSEVLASHYKFKVLSLDTQGRQFLVMVDLLAEQSLPADRYASIEALISNTAAQRYALHVKSVYWRQAGVAAVQTSTATKAMVPDVAAPPPRGRGGAKPQGFEPIGADEVQAFKNAIATSPTPVAQAGSGAPLVSGLRNAAAMTGFEDTQLLEPETAVSPLSRTQFGDL